MTARARLSQRDLAAAARVAREAGVRITLRCGDLVAVVDPTDVASPPMGYALAVN